MDIEQIFAERIKLVLAKEGPYSNNARDAGGETAWGITKARAVATGYTDPMRSLTREHAIDIYRFFYWRQPMFDQVAEVSPVIAALCLDFGINMGVMWPGHFLQRALNVLNKNGTLYPDLQLDNVTGAMTRSALQTFLNTRHADGLSLLADMMRGQASVRYMEIAEANPVDEDFEYGWQVNRAYGK